MNISDCRPRASSLFEAVTFIDTAKIKILACLSAVNADVQRMAKGIES